MTVAVYASSLKFNTKALSLTLNFRNFAITKTFYVSRRVKQSLTNYTKTFKLNNL